MMITFWRELNAHQRIGVLVCIPSLICMVVAAVPIGWYYIRESTISEDALASWAFGIMTAMYLDRHLVSLVSSRESRLLLGLLVMGTVALVGHAMQSSDVVFVGFPIKWAFFGIAMVLVITELAGQADIRAKAEGSRKRRNQRRRRRGR